MRNKRIVSISVTMLILASLPFIFSSLEYAKSENMVSERLNLKIESKLVTAISEAPRSDSVFDILVAAEKNQYSLSMIEEVAKGIKITKHWDMLGGFRANATAEHIEKLVEMSSVLRVEMNSEGQLFLDDARDAASVDWWTQMDSTIDGNTDGSKTTYSKDDIVIAILDSGIYDLHHDLDDDKVIAWTDIAGDSSGETQGTPYDDNGHGTHCASIAAGSGDGQINYRGVARYSALAIVKMAKWDGSYERAHAIEALNWVAQYSATYGIEIVSCSWGDSSRFGEYDLVAYYADFLVERYGIVVCVSAGNYGPYHNTITTPGTAKYVITVGAALDPSIGAGSNWQLWSYSSRGPCDDGRIKPDILAPGGQGIRSAKAGTTNQYEDFGGTSASCPFVAGLVALWLDKDYSLRYPPSDFHPHPRIKKLLMASAADMPDDGTPGLDNDFGAGRVDAYDEVNFYETDISSSMSNAPLVLRLSWSEHSYNRNNEPLWIHDPTEGADWYKIKCYQGLFIYISADGDPDLILRIILCDTNGHFIKQSTVGNYRTLGHWATYKGKYYIKIIVEQYSGDYYDITILTTPS